MQDVEEAQSDDNSTLIARIRLAIDAAGGRITFRDFMDLALYEPELGYYHRSGQKTGKAGDFITSPGVSALFGRTLGRYLEAQFVRGLPRQVVELGAGDGALAAELIGLADYTIVERSQDFRSRQRERLGDKVQWAAAVPEAFEGVVFSNELLDALPVHRVEQSQELYVRGSEDGFAGELDIYSTTRLQDYFDRLKLRPAGQAEVNLDAMDLMAGVYRNVSHGAVSQSITATPPKSCSFDTLRGRS